MKWTKNLWVLLLAIGLSACAAKTSRVDVDSDEPFSDTETSSKDLRTIAEKMASSLIQLPQINKAGTPPRIAFADVRNETNEILNKNMFIEKMRTLLIKNAMGRMIFLDREISSDVTGERKAKRKGELTSSTLKGRSGADFFLTGKLSSIDKVRGGKRSTYTRYAFRLTDAESTAIIWEDDYEVKKVGAAGLYDR